MYEECPKSSRTIVSKNFLIFVGQSAVKTIPSYTQSSNSPCRPLVPSSPVLHTVTSRPSRLHLSVSNEVCQVVFFRLGSLPFQCVKLGFRFARRVIMFCLWKSVSNSLFFLALHSAPVFHWSENLLHTHDAVYCYSRIRFLHSINVSYNNNNNNA